MTSSVPRIPPDRAAPRYLPQCPTVRPVRCNVITCRHHAYRAPTGCTIDVASEGPQNVLRVADILGVSDQTVKAATESGLRRARRNAERMGLSLAALLPAPRLDWDDYMPAGGEL